MSKPIYALSGSKRKEKGIENVFKNRLTDWGQHSGDVGGPIVPHLSNKEV